MTITEIKQLNKAAGNHYFERSTMRFFRSKVESRVYTGPGGIYFVTGEQFVGSDGIAAERKYTVRRFSPVGAYIETVGSFNALNRADALALAKRYAAGE